MLLKVISEKHFQNLITFCSDWAGVLFFAPTPGLYTYTHIRGSYVNNSALDFALKLRLLSIVHFLNGSSFI